MREICQQPLWALPASAGALPGMQTATTEGIQKPLFDGFDEAKLLPCLAWPESASLNLPALGSSSTLWSPVEKLLKDTPYVALATWRPGFQQTGGLSISGISHFPTLPAPHPCP